jgi:CheY-like chemotaxis protein
MNAYPQKKVRILHIEDNPADAKTLEYNLKNSGIKSELRVATKLSEGIELATENTFELIFLDLNLPDSHGIRTLNTLLERLPQLLVIVITGNNDEIVGEQSIKAGAMDYLTKDQLSDFSDKKNADTIIGRVIRYALQRYKTQKTLRQQAAELNIKDKRFQEVQKMANFGSWEMDVVSNEMKWTEEVFRIFGFESQSISPVFSDYLNYIHPEDRPSAEAIFNEVLKDGKLRKIDYRIIVDGRKIKYISNQVKVHYDEVLGVTYLFGAVQDVTEAKLSRELMAQKNLSDQTSKIKESVLKELGFNIRTPLSSLLQLSYLLEKAEVIDEVKEHLNGLQLSINDLSVATNNLMNFSILVSEKVTVDESQFKVEDLIARIEQIFRLRANKKNVCLDLKIFSNVPETLIGDANKINQIIYNLVDNAIKFTADNTGEVSLKVACEVIKGEEARLFIIVEDNGIGISASQLKALETADELLAVNYEDSKKEKLGIAITNKLVKTMKGAIEMQSQIGKGSKFSVSLPVKIAFVQKRKGGDKPTAPLKILLVEDHFLNQIATKKVLTAWSDFVKVDIAENGLVGFEKFREYGYDLVLMDLQMPVMDGFESASNIRELNQNVPIVALTAKSNSREEEEKTRKAGMNEYMSKPFKPQDLYAKIMSVL